MCGYNNIEKLFHLDSQNLYLNFVSSIFVPGIKNEVFRYIQYYMQKTKFYKKKIKINVFTQNLSWVCIFCSILFVTFQKITISSEKLFKIMTVV